MSKIDDASSRSDDMDKAVLAQLINEHKELSERFLEQMDERNTFKPTIIAARLNCLETAMLKIVRPDS